MPTKDAEQDYYARILNAVREVGVSVKEKDNGDNDNDG